MTILSARASIGLTGAISDIVGTAVSTITKESGNGNFSVTLADPYNAFLMGQVMFACESDSVAKTCVSGTAQVDRLTFVAKASCVSGDFFIVTDTAGVKWAASIDVTGSAAEPTSALWTAVGATKKVHVDISAATTDAEVAGAVRAAFAALTGISTTITVSVVTGAYFDCTEVYRAPVAVPVLYKEDGAATPTSFTTTVGTAGVQTAYDITNTSGETMTIVAHGFTTGKLVALSINSGALPTGWAAGAYFVIAVSADKIALASTLANAEAGTKVAISDYGDATKTVTVTPTAPFGSLVARTEFTSVSLKANVQANGKIYFTCYDYAGTQVNPSNGSKMYIELHLRNSNVSGAGE